jgi:PAS domain S-box-containing protein
MGVGLVLLREEKMGDYRENVINYANAPIIMWNREGWVTVFNHAFERLAGYAGDEVISQKMDMLFPGARRDESLSRVASTLSGE